MMHALLWFLLLFVAFRILLYAFSGASPDYTLLALQRKWRLDDRRRREAAIIRKFGIRWTLNGGEILGLVIILGMLVFLLIAGFDG